MVLVSLAFLIYLAPLADDVNTAIQINGSIYQISHSEWYNGATSFLQSVKGLSGLPVIGTAAVYGSSIGDFLKKVHDSSETLKHALDFIKFIIDITIPSLIIFGILFIVGLWMVIVSPSATISPSAQPTEASKYCSKCGTKNLMSSKFCESCGVKI